jgi:virginiamycin B lyase
VQIPFASLKAETEFPAPSKPRWIAIADQVYFPGVDALQPIDPKPIGKMQNEAKLQNEPKLAAPIGGMKQPCGGAISAFGHLWAPLCGERALAKIKTNPISRPEPPKPESAKPQSPKPESPKPESAKPETPKPEAPKTEAKAEPKPPEVVARLTLGEFGAQPALASSDDSIWVLADRKTSLFRIDPETVEVVAEIRLPAACSSILSAEKALWVACPDSDRVLRIDPRTNLVEKSIKLTTPRSLAFGEGSLWVYCQKEGAVERIDPKTNKSTKSISLATPGIAGEIAFGEGAVWVTSPGFPLTRIDPKDEKVVQQFYGDGGGAIAVGQGWIWLANVDAGTLWKIDPKRVVATLAE